MSVAFTLLGPVSAADPRHGRLDLRGPRHREVLARLLVARGRVVSLPALVDDLWEDPPPGAAGSVQTFVGALRRGLEPDRAPRTPPRLIVSAAGGYALRPGDSDSVDAWAFEAEVTGTAGLAPELLVSRLQAALRRWQGPALADVGDAEWVRAERARLSALRATAHEDLAEARIAVGGARAAVPDLEAHVEEHPWRERGWRLLATALHHDERPSDALAVLRRARRLFATELGLDPGPRLASLERDVLHRAAHRERDLGPDDRLWGEVAAAYERVAPARSSTRLRSTVNLLAELAVTSGAGLEASRTHRLEAIAAAEERGDPELTAGVVSGFDVPGTWARSDDPEQAAAVVAAAWRAESRLPPTADRLRARLFATIAMESRGTADPRVRAVAEAAVRSARELGDPHVLALALSGLHLQCFSRAGLARERGEVGRELVELSRRHELTTFRIAGELVCLHSACAVGRFAEAEERARELDRLADRHDRPAVHAFTSWFRAVRLDADGAALSDVEAAYRRADEQLHGMPGVQRGALPLAVLAARLTRGGQPPVVPCPAWGPYLPWVRPHLLLARGRLEEAAAALRAAPPPPADHLLEATWTLLADAAIALDDEPVMRRALQHLEPASGEIAGAGSGMLLLWPVDTTCGRLRSALDRFAPGTRAP